MTPQQKLQAKLTAAGIPAKEIKVYGSQIMIVAWSHAAAKKWVSLLSRFARVRGIVESIETNKKQTGTRLAERHTVWLVAAVI